MRFLWNALRRTLSPFVFDAKDMPREMSDHIAQDIGLSDAELARLRARWPSNDGRH